ncbi:hypothetical protein NJ7G_2662 [Natrinema sp. J7-2]|nr:hypothetical protein NJ7G_2662 [Natrinema sp. J7-2]
MPQSADESQDRVDPAHVEGTVDNTQDSILLTISRACDFALSSPTCVSIRTLVTS